MTRSRDEIVSAARDVIQDGSKSFRMASRLFDRTTRERAWLLYCWCRHCDDVSDGQTLGRGNGPRGRVADLTGKTNRALLGEADELPFEALAQLRRECPLPDRLVDAHLEGFRLDEAGWRPANEEQLIQYCFHVAGAVGCMMAIVMGVRPDDQATLDRAADLGIAFQLSNIVRDIREDAEGGRCYLPTEWLKESGLTEAMLRQPGRQERLLPLIARLVEKVNFYETRARLGVPQLPLRSRWAVLSAAGIYGRIGRKVEALGANAWDRRVVVPKYEKAAIMLSALTEAIAA